ncbi:magnesium transporter [Candidatus Kaiserbacteria bacterium]|nr:magnesium transporter [Candidatus Kaiserbacteria bacterium]
MAQTRKQSKIAHQLTYQVNERMQLFRTLSVPEQSAVIEELSPHIQRYIMEHLRSYEIVNLVDHLDLHQAQHLLARLTDSRKRERIIKRLQGDAREKLEYFLRFHPKATLSIINFNYVFLSGDTTIADAAVSIDEYYDETGKFPELLVHENGTLIGAVSLSTLVRERSNSQLRKYVQPVPTITYQAEVNDIINVLTSEKSPKVVVLDHDTSVLGVVYADAARSLFGKLPAESLYDFVGVDDSERPFDPISRKVNQRYRWLILNLITTFMASGVILMFQGTLNTLTLMSVYIPVVAGMGGNAATQAFAIMVRGLTLGTVSLQNCWLAIWRELWAGFFNGIIIGAIVTVISLLWQGDPWLGVVVFLTLVGAHMAAGLAGALIPLVMKHFGKDPAATSSIFITTVTDVFGLILLLGLATWIML